MATVDEISPATIGEDKIGLALEDPLVTIQTFTPFGVSIDYSATLPEGLRLPLELIVSGPKAGQLDRRVFRDALPSSVTIKPTVRGRHSILFREMYHNRWQGRLTVEVEGEDID